MKIIRRVEVMEVDGDQYELETTCPPAFITRGDRGFRSSETVTGEWFIDSKGQHHSIGFTEEAEKHLGILLDTIEAEDKALQKARAEIVNKRDRIQELEKRLQTEVGKVVCLREKDRFHREHDMPKTLMTKLKYLWG